MPVPAESVLKQSGKRPRFSEMSRAETEPGFLAVDPQSGVPTPPPRLAFTSIPERRVTDAKLRSLPLDHRAGFVLAHIDGMTDIRELIDICGMAQEEFAALIERLLDLRVIAMK